MGRKLVRLMRGLALSAAALLLGITCACNLGPPEKGQQSSSEAAVKAASSRVESDDPGIDLQCAADRIRKAPAAFHWSYKKQVIGLSDAAWEADITPNAIVGTFIDSSGAHAIHGARSDGTSWNSAVMILTGPLPASAFALVNNSSVIAPAGAANVNGENTVKYTIDTTDAAGSEADLIKSVLGTNGFIKGAAWVTRQGCPVKFVLDAEDHHNGTVQKEHYELNVTPH